MGIDARPSNENLKPFTVQRKTKLTVSQTLINISTMFTVGNNATCVSQLEGKNKPLGKTIPSLCQLQLFPE